MNHQRIGVLAAVALSAALWTHACGDGATEPAPAPDPPRPTTVTVTPATAELSAIGATVQLAAEVRDQNGNVMGGAAVAWTSSDAAVATVDASGLAAATANGTVTITATAGSASGTAMVNVAQVVDAVAVTPAADTLLPGDTLRLAAEATDANGHPVTGTEFAWASSDTLVAVVDDGGLVTGVGTGEAEVTATAAGITGRAELAVAAPVPTTVGITPDTVEFTALGQSVQLGAQVRDQAGRVMAEAAVSWSSADTLVVTVDSAGLVTAVGTGSAAVAAAAGEARGEALATVMQSAGSVVVKPAEDTIAPGDTLRLLAEAFDENGHPVEGATFTWSSTDVSVARVDGSGLVTGADEGAATITATAGDAWGTATIMVENPDRAALVALYEATDGPNWVNNDNWLTDAPLREWYGVTTDASGRVIGLDLSARWDNERQEDIPHGLTGLIPPELGNLTNLEILGLGGNDLRGSIPPELGNLTNLEILSLEHNNLRGPIPPELGRLSRLELLSLQGNTLTGTIPEELGNLSALRRWLQLGDNQLSGRIPPELGRLANLEILSLSGNRLTGAIPPELGNLANLARLQLANNGLTGAIPPELGSLANLEYMGLGGNELTGPIPPQLGRLASLEALVLNVNALTGPVPPELGDLSSLRVLGLARNRLSGPIPRALLKLRLERGFGADDNAGLCAPGTTEFIAWLQGIPNTLPICNEADVAALEALFDAAGGTDWTNSDGWLGDGSVGEWYGVSADSLGRVLELRLSRNGLSGRIPGQLGNLDAMTRLSIEDNDLSGRLPITLAGLQLQEFRFAGTGLCTPRNDSFREWLNTIPTHEGTGVECARPTDRDILVAFYEATGGPQWENNTNWLTDAPLRDWHGVSVREDGRVFRLRLPDNGLEGTIPSELSSLSSLRRLTLWENRLTGRIPTQLGNLSDLLDLDLGGNRLTGSIPTELGNLSRLGNLDLRDNDLTGRIPAELGGLTNLRGLYLFNNDLGGPIPPRLGQLSDLNRLNLGDNQLSGPIPPELGSLEGLEQLLLANNALAGSVPDELGGLTRLTQLVFTGNPSMSGSLPTSLTQLQVLDLLAAGGTSLCAPSDAVFQAWLAGVQTSRVSRCGGRQGTAAYLVQAVQSLDYPVPLIEGRPALLRVFVTAPDAGGEGIPDVRATFYLGGQEKHLVDIPRQSSPIPSEIDEGVFAKSANAPIPADIIQSGLEMVIEIDPEGNLDPGLGVTKRIPETGLLSVDVHTMPVFDLTVVPFLWLSDPDSSVIARTAQLTAEDKLFGHTRALLPVGQMNVTTHEPVLTSANDAYTLLAETEALRIMEGSRGHYLGTMSDHTWPPGVAYLSGKSSFSVLYEPTLAHELGHNMSLAHAPCGGAGGPDPAFPTGDGSTGAWGYDLALVPPDTPDLMSYCLPKWISDYHFTKALRHRLINEASANRGLSADGAGSLLLWGGVDSLGVPHLEPAFVVDAPSALPGSTGGHRIIGRTASGGQLFNLSFNMPAVADGDGSSSFAFVLPVRSGWKGNLASITLTGPGGSTTLDGDTDLPMAILRNLRTGQVRGFLRDLPPPTQAARDAAGSAAGPGLEVLFSRGIPGVEAWR